MQLIVASSPWDMLKKFIITSISVLVVVALLGLTINLVGVMVFVGLFLLGSNLTLTQCMGISVLLLTVKLIFSYKL